MIKPVCQTNPINEHRVKEKPKSNTTDFDQVLGKVMRVVHEEKELFLTEKSILMGEGVKT